MEFDHKDLLEVSRDVSSYLDNLTSRMEARHGSDVSALLATAITTVLISTLLDMAAYGGVDQVKRASGALHRVVDNQTAWKLADMLSERVKEINER